MLEILEGVGAGGSEGGECGQSVFEWRFERKGRREGDTRSLGL